jgi:5-methylcytosine-specific restriction protein A
MRKRRTAEHREAICKARNWLCHICELPVDPVHQRWELDHIIPLASGGKDDDDNLSPAHAKCHLTKTIDDVGKIAKGKRMRAFHLGTKVPSQRIMPGSRRSKWKKKVSGEVVLRHPERDGR